MTLFHFGNCFLLAYVPYFLTYKYSGLSEYGASKKCIQAGVMYLGTQLCKMLFLATFFPASDSGPTGNVDAIGEFFRCTLDLSDLFALHFIMSWVAGKGEMKFLVAGIGWATAELVMTRFLPLWVGARGMEFSWKYIQMSLDSNIRLVQHITTAMLVWIWSRHDLKKTLFPVVIAMLAIGCYKPLILIAFAEILAIKSWTLLAVDAFMTLAVALTSLQFYVSLTHGFSYY